MPQSAPSRRTPRRRNAGKQQSQYTAPAAKREVSKILKQEKKHTKKTQIPYKTHRCIEKVVKASHKEKTSETSTEQNSR